MPNALLNRRAVAWLGALTLCALTVFIYRPAWHGGFIWDDDRYVTNNVLLVAPDGLRRIWLSLDAPSQYFPLSYTVLRLERAFWHLNPSGYHLVSVFLHAVNALLVWWVLARLRVPGAWLAATVFAVHPVQVESVAWISELKNVLMALFFLLTLAAWVEYIDSTQARRRIFYVLALAFCLLALLAKSTACTLPAALLLVLWLKEKPIGRRELSAVLPFVVLAVAIGLVAIWWEKYHQGTRMLPNLVLAERVLVASRAVWFYLGKIFWPSNLTFIYPQWKIDPNNVLSYFWLALCVLAGALIYFSRGAAGRGVEVAILYFVATLAPLLGFVMLYTFRYTFVADHYQYLACIGPIALVSAAAAIVARSGNNLRVIVIGLATAAIFLLSFLTSRQSAMYRSAEALWRSTIARNPDCWMAYNNLGVLQSEKGDIAGAISNYRQALRLSQNYPEAHYNLASAVLHEGQVDEAIRECELALELLPNEPDAHIILGNAFLAKEGVDQAIDEYNKALAVRPDDSIAHYNLALALQKKGEAERAASEFEKARELTAQEHH